MNAIFILLKLLYYPPLSLYDYSLTSFHTVIVMFLLYSYISGLTCSDQLVSSDLIANLKCSWQGLQVISWKPWVVCPFLRSQTVDIKVVP